MSRDVKFFEDVFPFLDPITSNINPETIVPIHKDVRCDFAECIVDDLGLHNHLPQTIITENTTSQINSPTQTSPKTTPTTQVSKQPPIPNLSTQMSGPDLSHSPFNSPNSPNQEPDQPTTSPEA